MPNMTSHWHALIATVHDLRLFSLARVIKEGQVKTHDMGGKNTTLEVAREVAKYAAS